MEEAKKLLPTNNSLLIDLDDTSGQSLLTERDIKPSTAFVATQVKEEEVDGISMFGGSSNAGAARTVTPKRTWKWRPAKTTN